ncbi:MAG: sugar transporter [Paracoccaceae bacterium]
MSEAEVINPPSPAPAPPRRQPGRQGKTPGKGKAHGPRLAPPPARPARLRRRHIGVYVSFLACVIAPVAALAFYLWVYAQDQYASVTGFTLRSEEAAPAADLLGGLAGFTRSTTGVNADVLSAFIQSQQIVERIDARLNLREHYSQVWDRDPLFSIWGDATIEDLLWFWNRVVQVSYDKASGLTDVQVRAFSPQMAQAIATSIVAESESMINALNAQSRRDAMAMAQRDLADAQTRVLSARQELADFRARTQIVDPAADLQGRMGVLNTLQQQLAEALIESDLLAQITTESDPRARQARRRIAVIEDRIATERARVATQDVTTQATDYPRLIAQFEALSVNQEFAERSLTAALAAHDAARSNAGRQSLYLATYVTPTLAERAQYPNRPAILGLTALFLFLGWSVLTTLIYSLRDRG